MCHELKVQLVRQSFSDDFPLQKPGKLLDLQDRAFDPENPIGQNQLRDEWTGRCQCLDPRRLGDVLICLRRLEHDDIDVREVAQPPFDQWSYIVPVESSVATAERRDGDGADVLFTNGLLEILEARTDPFQSGLSAPVLLRREVDDPPWRSKDGRSFGDEHFSRAYLTEFAGGSVFAEVGGIRLLEHKGDALAHHTNGVDGVDHCFRMRVEQVARGEADHEKYHSVRRTILTVTPKSAQVASMSSLMS